MSDINSESLENNNEIFFHPKKVLYFRDENGQLVNLSNDNKELLTLKKEIIKNTKLTLATKIDISKNKKITSNKLSFRRNIIYSKNE